MSLAVTVSSNPNVRCSLILLSPSRLIPDENESGMCWTEWRPLLFSEAKLIDWSDLYCVSRELLSAFWGAATAPWFWRRLSKSWVFASFDWRQTTSLRKQTAKADFFTARKRRLSSYSVYVFVYVCVCVREKPLAGCLFALLRVWSVSKIISGESCNRSLVYGGSTSLWKAWDIFIWIPRLRCVLAGWLLLKARVWYGAAGLCAGSNECPALSLSFLFNPLHMCLLCTALRELKAASSQTESLTLTGGDRLASAWLRHWPGNRAFSLDQRDNCNICTDTVNGIIYCDSLHIVWCLVWCI